MSNRSRIRAWSLNPPPPKYSEDGVVEPHDAEGRDLRAGDWVRVISVPVSIRNMPDESKEAFSSAVGLTLQIENIEPYRGELELVMHDDRYRNTIRDIIWLEPFCALRFRRPRRHSKRFLMRRQTG